MTLDDEDLNPDDVWPGQADDHDHEHDDTPSRPWSYTPAAMKEYAAHAPEPLIEGLVPSGAVVTFAGEPGIGKSFVALSWAASVAEGVPWCGRSVRGPLTVAYVLGEGFSQFGRRVDAWEKTHGRALGDNLHFVDGASQGLDLCDPAKVDDLIEQLERIGAGLLVLDTFSMLAHVRSENDNAEVAAVFAALHRIVRVVGCTVVVVHHVSKGAGQVRGATAFKGNADTVVMAGGGARDDEETFYLSTRADDEGKQRDFDPVRIAGFSIASPGTLVHDTMMAKEDDARTAMGALMAAG